MTSPKIKVRKGGVDTIVAFVIILIPITYIIAFMIATIYHFSVQQYINQVVKETLIMASSYGTLTDSMVDYMDSKLKPVIGEYGVNYHVRQFDYDSGEIGSDVGMNINALKQQGMLQKGDLLGIYITSSKPSVLGTVSNFSLFSNSSSSNLYYTSYREEIIRNVSP